MTKRLLFKFSYGCDRVPGNPGLNCGVKSARCTGRDAKEWVLGWTGRYSPKVRIEGEAPYHATIESCRLAHV